MGKVSEATWHWQDPTNLPAAANTIPAVVGITIKGFSVFEGQTALIPIAKLYDAGDSRPLPFATDFTLTYPQYQAYGESAVLLADVTAASGSSSTLLIASAITTGSTGFFADQRATSGLSAAGNPPVANRALLYRRSAPPQVVPITTGLTMKPPALPAPPIILHPPIILPVALTDFRLRAVLRGLPQVVSDVPTTLRTTVTKVAAAAGVARMAAPLANALGSSLIRVKAPTAPAPTRLAKAASTLRSPEVGWASGTGHQQELTNALASFKGNGITVPAGTVHIWDVPAGRPGRARRDRRLRLPRHLPHARRQSARRRRIPANPCRHAGNHRGPARQLRHGRHRMPRQAARWNHRGRSGLRRCILHRRAGGQIDSRGLAGG